MIEATIADPASNTVTIGKNVIKLKEPIGALTGGDKISIALRPEAGSLSESTKADTALTGTVVLSNFLGSVIRTKIDIGGNQISFDMFNSPDISMPKPGDIRTLRFNASDFLIVRE
jgi:putative spermidine/putrescine transport system ATP-binding protein